MTVAYDEVRKKESKMCVVVMCDEWARFAMGRIGS